MCHESGQASQKRIWNEEEHPIKCETREPERKLCSVRACGRSLDAPSLVSDEDVWTGSLSDDDRE